MAFKVNLTGQKIEKVTIISFSHNTNGYSMWNAICDCGNSFVLRGVNFTRGLSTSCGCNRKGHRTPNVSHPLYKVWLSMRDRCNNPNSINFHRYGGRGIRCCERWDNYEIFFSDVIECYRKGLQLDRFPNPDGDYEPLNFRWATRPQQMQNSTKAKLKAEQVIQIRNSSEGLKSLSEKYGVGKDTIWSIKTYKTWTNI